MSSSLPFAGIGPYGTYGNLGLYGALVTYPSQVLTESSPPQSFAEPLTIAEVKAFLKIPERSPVDTFEDDLVRMLISAARGTVEREQGSRDLIVRQWDIHFDYWPSYRLEFGKPLRSVDLMQYTDSNGQIWAMNVDDDFIVDTSKIPGIIAPLYNKTWPTFAPWPSSGILIRATTGYARDDQFWLGEIGQQLRVGMLMLISEWFNNRLPYDTPVANMPFPLQVLISGGALARAR